MSQSVLSFNDGAAYELMMGRWSRLAGVQFIDWLAPAAGSKWLDVGCGNGAFTEVIEQSCAPAGIEAVDPSEGQLAFARQRGIKSANFTRADAMSLPFGDNMFDIAVMALVMFFVPQPARGVAEMARVIRKGGLVASYTWDTTRGGFPQEALQDEVRRLGMTVNQPPSTEASRMEALVDYYAGAGLEEIETKEIIVQRTFANFDDYWTTNLNSNTGAQIASMKPEDAGLLQERLRKRLPRDRSGRVCLSARANAIRGRKVR